MQWSSVITITIPIWDTFVYTENMSETTWWNTQPLVPVPATPPIGHSLHPFGQDNRARFDMADRNGDLYKWWFIVVFPIKNCVFPIKNGDFPINNSDFPIKNCDFPIKHGDFPIKNCDFALNMVIYGLWWI